MHWLADIFGQASNKKVTFNLIFLLSLTISNSIYDRDIGIKVKLITTKKLKQFGSTLLVLLIVGKMKMCHNLQKNCRHSWQNKGNHFYIQKLETLSYICLTLWQYCSKITKNRSFPLIFTEFVSRLKQISFVEILVKWNEHGHRFMFFLENFPYITFTDDPHKQLHIRPGVAGAV